MQRPCERENRASVSCRDALKYCPYYFQSKGSNVSFARLPDLQKKKERTRWTRSFPREIDRLVEIFAGTGSSTSKRGPVKYRLGVARVSACQRVARVPAPEGLKEFVDCTRVICASTSTKWLSRLFFRPRVFLRLSVRRRPFSPSWVWGGGQRRGEAFRVKERSRWREGREGGLRYAGQRGASPSSRGNAQKPRLRRVRIIGAVERGRSFSSDHLSGNLSFVSNGLSPSRDAIRI